jgi:hypothetical protein
MKRRILTAALLLLIGHIMICPYEAHAATLGPACGLLNGGATVKVQDVTVPSSPVLIQDTTAVGVVELPYTATKSCYTYDITPTQGHDYMGIFTDESTPARVVPAYLSRYETYIDAPVSEAAGDDAATIWAYADRQITSAYTDEGTPRDMAGTGGAASIIIPAIASSPYSTTAVQKLPLKIVSGNTPTVTFTLGSNYTDWHVWFGCKKQITDTAYSLAVREATWTNAATGAGYITLTAAETDIAMTHICDTTVKKDAAVLTAARFTLVVEPAVFK